MAIPRRVRSLRLVVNPHFTTVTLWFAVVAAIGCGGPSAPAVSDNAAEVSVAQARALYIRKCSLCHGEKGDLMASKSPDLTISTLTLEERIALITYGKGTMPGQKGILNSAEIRAVAGYIDRFQD